MRFRPRPRAIVSFYGYGDVAGPWYSQSGPGYLRDLAVSPEDAERAVGREPLAQGDESRRFVFYRYARGRGLWPRLVAGQERTEDHSTVLCKGHGQLDEQAASGSTHALRFGHHPEMVHAERRGGQRDVRFTRDGRTVMIDWDLAERTVAIHP